MVARQLYDHGMVRSVVFDEVRAALLVGAMAVVLAEGKVVVLVVVMAAAVVGKRPALSVKASLTQCRLIVMLSRLAYLGERTRSLLSDKSSLVPHDAQEIPVEHPPPPPPPRAV